MKFDEMTPEQQQSAQEFFGLLAGGLIDPEEDIENRRISNERMKQLQQENPATSADLGDWLEEMRGWMRWMRSSGKRLPVPSMWCGNSGISTRKCGMCYMRPGRLETWSLQEFKPHPFLRADGRTWDADGVVWDRPEKSEVLSTETAGQLVGPGLEPTFSDTLD